MVRSNRLTAKRQVDETSTADRSPREMEIIRSAYRTMAGMGSHRISLQQVADDAGVSKALLLYHFGTREALLFAAMKWALERTEVRIRGGLESAGRPRDQITALIEAIFVSPEANREFYLFYLDLIEHASRSPGFGALSDTLEEVINGLFAEVIDRGVRERVFAVDDVGVAARHMRALIEGTFLQWIQTDDWRESHQTWKYECRFALLRMLGAGQES